MKVWMLVALLLISVFGFATFIRSKRQTAAIGRLVLCCFVLGLLLGALVTFLGSGSIWASITLR